MGQSGSGGLGPCLDTTGVRPGSDVGSLGRSTASFGVRLSLIVVVVIRILPDLIRIFDFRVFILFFCFIIRSVGAVDVLPSVGPPGYIIGYLLPSLDMPRILHPP